MHQIKEHLIAQITIQGEAPPFKLKKGQYGNIYAEHGEWKKEARLFIQSKLPPDFEPLDIPVAIRVNHFAPLPKRGNKYKDGDWCTNKPDFTNIIKVIEDCLTGTIIIDDCRVVRLKEMDQVYSDNPRVEIEVYGLNNTI